MKNEIVFTMGSPAAGKSTISKREYPSHTVIDCDDIKKRLPNYDPKNPETTHALSSQIAESLFNDAIKSGAGSYIVDGTGSNSDKMVRKMTEAMTAGFEVTLLYVVTSLKNALVRNASRERNVPKAIVIEKYNDVRYAFNLVAPHADNVRVINND